MKSRITVALLLTAWVACAIGLARPDPEYRGARWANAIKTHKAFEARGVAVRVPGFIPAAADRTVALASGVAAAWKDLGFSLRVAADMSPAWLAIESDPDDAEKRQILLREEVADIFSWPDSTVDRAADWVAARAHALGPARFQKTAVLVVPTKAAANRLRPSFSQARRPDVERLGLVEAETPSDPFENQICFERALARMNVAVISLIDRYRRLQAERKSPLYPRGESHWSGETVESLGDVVALRLSEIDPRAKACARASVESAAEEAPAVYWGDLFEALGAEPSFAGAKAFGTAVRTFAARPAPPPVDARCPDVVLFGSSYGAGEFSGVSLASSIQRRYAGRVINKSVAGSMPEAQIRAAAAYPNDGDPIVIWEFPFRYAKNFVE